MLPFYSASGWQIFWQTAGTVCSWQHICQTPLTVSTGATQKCFPTISPGECTSHHLFLNICWWHHRGGSQIQGNMQCLCRKQSGSDHTNNRCNNTWNEDRLPNAHFSWKSMGQLSLHTGIFNGKPIKYYQPINYRGHQPTDEQTGIIPLSPVLRTSSSV